MTCTLHIPVWYDPLRMEYRCVCGAFVISAAEAAFHPRWRWLLRLVA